MIIVLVRLLISTALAFIIFTSGSSVQAGSLKRINPPELPDPTPFYTQVTVASPHAQLVFIAGQYGPNGFDQEGKPIFSDDLGTQINRSFDNLKIALEAAGAKPEDVAKTTVLIVDYTPAALEPLAAATAKLWGNDVPAATLMGVPQLAFEDQLFEIEAFVIILDQMASEDHE